MDYYPHFFTQPEAEQYWRLLYHGIDWQEESILLFGKSVKVPRLICWYGDNDAHYRYSGTDHHPTPWIKPLTDIKIKLERYFHQPFNSVLANLYRNGQDSTGWHADNEPHLGINPIIASVSFGVPRFFYLRHKKQKRSIKMELAHGSVLLMHGETQHYWKHTLPKAKNSEEARINLTFRLIKPDV